MPGILFTIGHSTHPIGRLLELLSLYAVALVCDVRSTPYSRFNPQFNREPLAAALEAHNIAYLFLGEELGGKPRDSSPTGTTRERFDLIAKGERFRHGLRRLVEEIQVRRTAILCAEKDPARCHRTHLICPHIPQGIAIRHILADGSLRDHRDLLGEEEMGGGSRPWLL